MFSRSPRLTPADVAPPQNVNEKIESLKSAVVSIIAGTEWPSESNTAAQGLLDIVKSSSDLHESLATIPRDLQGPIEQYLKALEDVHLRLKDASSKTSMQKWKFLQRIKSMASIRESKCTLLLKTCQDDLSKALNSVRERLDEEKGEGDNSVDGTKSPKTDSQPNAQKPEQLSVPPPSIQITPAKHGTALESSLSSTPPNQNSLSCVLEGTPAASPISKEALTIARKTFKSVEIASGSIPVAGSYVGAVAKVGLAFVESIQTMDKNDDLANDLGAQTSKLSKLVEGFTKKTKADQGAEIAEHINDLHKELRIVHDKVKEWKYLGRFNRAFHARDHAEALKAYQSTVQVALEEMQLLVGLDTHHVVNELKNRQIQEEHRHLLRCLGDGKYGAQGNAIEDVICFPGTRVEILERIDSWIGNLSDRVLWIRGMAGRGKSTIASTVVHSWKYRASCAIFHFRRGQSTLNARIVCALARQLACSLVPEVRNAVLESVRENEDVADQRLKEQFETLFVAPFARLNNHPHPILITLDALDECDNLQDAVDFVRLIDRHSAGFPGSVKFLLTSRPEAQLVRALEPKQWLSEDLDTVTDVNNDLERFVEQAFQNIRDSDPEVPNDWPFPRDMERLVQMSQGLFQWARTAITYVSNGSPVDRLRVLLMRPSMWSGLDELYSQILSKAFDNVRLDPIRRDILSRVLGTLVVAPYPVSLEIISTFYGSHEIFRGTNREHIIPFLRRDILADLNSLLFIPPSTAEPMRLMHTSIRDLLTSKDRCGQQPYYIDLVRSHKQLAITCFDIMWGGLKENICNLSDISKPSSEVQDITERDVSKAVRYCCRAWSTHLTEGVQWLNPSENTTPVDLAAFESFSKEKVTYWLEVMSLIRATKEAIHMARQAHQWLLRQPSGVFELSSLTTLWNDIERFITTFSEPISFGPLHVYVSALPHCPVETEMWRLYGKYAKVHTIRGPRTSTWPSNLWVRSTSTRVKTITFSPNSQLLACGCQSGKIEVWDTQTGTPARETLTGHDGHVTSVSYSPDGTVLASGSEDGTIRLWDAQTGAAVGEPFPGHNGEVHSISYSPDGKVLAFGSDDSTVRLWDTQTGATLGETLTGHNGQVLSISYSPDGKVLASGSTDNTIRLWDTETRAAVGEPLTGHIDCVRTVCFSPDGKVLASGSDDKTIRLWDTQTGAVMGEPLTGHTDWVRTVHFSPDGKVLASGSDDRTIRLWDGRTRLPLGGPLTGHTDWVMTVSFSPDGKVLASGSDDHTIRLWDTQTGAAFSEPLTGHTDSFRRIYFSPDGRVLASGSDDRTVRLWDTQTGAALGEPLTGHNGRVNSISYSPDGKVLASGSDDSTVRLWDTQIGAAVGEPLNGHNGQVTSISYSSNGKVLASASTDKTIRLWDTQTGAALGEPLTGHIDWVGTVCFSPDGKVLASGSNDKTIRLWDTQTGAVMGEPLTDHTYWVIAICFSPDGKVLASRSINEEIRFWNAETREALAKVDSSGGIRSMHFSPDGMLLITNHTDGSLASWSLTTYQTCDTPHQISRNTPSFENHWIMLSSSRLFWLPPQYWGQVDRLIGLSGGTLVVFNNGTLSFFDVSQIL